MSEEKKGPPKKRSVVHMVPLEPYAVQFADSDGHVRSYYAFKNPAGIFFMLDVTRDDIPLSEPINVPDLARVEKLQKPVPLGKPKIFNPPQWLEEEMNSFLKNPEKAQEREEVEEKKDSGAMKAAMMGEEG